MAGKAIGISMNYGYPGNYARTPDDIVMSRKVADDSAAIPFGAAVVLNADNTYSLAGTGFTAAKFAGVALRIVKQAISYAEQNETVYQPSEAASVIERGQVTVLCNVGTPTAGGDVYVRIAANAGIAGGVVGGFEAAADGANTVLLTNAKWATGYKDANNICELAILTRINP